MNPVLQFPKNDALRALEELASGREISDAAFDQIFPVWAAQYSRQHWTPVRVALQALRLLDLNAGSRLLDVGSGVGKFCVIGSLVTAARFTGIEQRPHFVEAAEDVIRVCGIRRVSVKLGNLSDLDWREFDAFYFFNPFQEQLHAKPVIDDRVYRCHSLHSRYVRISREQLNLAPLGAKVVTYHGFGGRMPKSYEHIDRVRAGTGFLDLYVKTSALRPL